MIELVLTSDSGNVSLNIAESARPEGVARLEIKEFGVTAGCDLKPETIDRIVLELAILKNKFETGGYTYV